MCIHPMTVSNSIQQILIEIQGEINESTIIVEELRSLQQPSIKKWADQAGGKTVRIELN